MSGLRRRVASVRLRGGDGPQVARARRLLDLYLAEAERHGVPFPEIARQVRAGLPALRIAGAELQGQADAPAFSEAACAPGCAFCCILAGEDGGVILEAEARQLHAALAPLAGAPDGRAWSDRACPALDPATRTCRVYEARPMICRTYVSPDADACADVARGLPARGPGVVGAQGTLLAVQSLGRAALEGAAQVPTYALARIAAAAVEGVALDAALGSARHRPRVLEDERTRLAPAD
ncbi:YkgJ family cysteine cluster protein [Roseivivax isoporae]|uniref:Fe-S oxidoreductase n=1 Tax=Roseivivax isoporae LMG 25204 TaxID=1449351 RepID=X7F9G6_9RHOB|nr:YkgJ family cysteine cluster protein [Roseivivax isoporae]ETX28756.1 Fe-S oxidoreductase [Roseivivax isoporae LMG 25204]